MNEPEEAITEFINKYFPGSNADAVIYSIWEYFRGRGKKGIVIFIIDLTFIIPNPLFSE